MSVLDFYKDYPDEESCKLNFKVVQDKEGITCRKCDDGDTTGNRTNGATSARTLGSELHCARER